MEEKFLFSIKVLLLIAFITVAVMSALHSMLGIAIGQFSLALLCLYSVTADLKARRRKKTMKLVTTTVLSGVTSIFCSVISVFCALNGMQASWLNFILYATLAGIIAVLGTIALKMEQPNKKPKRAFYFF